ncbi:hypothetical protein [Citrobacter sp. U14242]|uniref:hypothetical protein n=1 Tax=Citrobacter sp. U14242 TaxID=3390192 RepID=UPI00397C53FD
MKTVTIDSVRARLSFLEGLNARGVGTAVPQQQFEIACLRELLALLVCRPMPVTVKLPADNAAESELSEDDATAWFDEGWNARGKADKEALIAAGIGVKGE